jgi:hypothetical protein
MSAGGREHSSMARELGMARALPGISRLADGGDPVATRELFEIPLIVPRVNELNILHILVGAAGFEPTTCSTQNCRATRLRYTPMIWEKTSIHA